MNDDSLGLPLLYINGELLTGTDSYLALVQKYFDNYIKELQLINLPVAQCWLTDNICEILSVSDADINDVANKINEKYGCKVYYNKYANKSALRRKAKLEVMDLGDISFDDLDKNKMSDENISGINYVLNDNSDHASKVNINNNTNSNLDWLSIKSPNANFRKITKYLEENLTKILPQIQFPRLKNGSYKFSWQGNLGETGYREDSKPVIDYLLQDSAKREILGTDTEVDNWENIVNKYAKSVYFMKFGKQIRNYIIDLNNEVNQQRAFHLLNLNDKINDVTKIDYNPYNDHEREAPVIVYQAEFENGRKEDLVFIGDPGTSHGMLMMTKMADELKEKKAKPIGKDYKIYYAYALGKIVFMDPKIEGTYNDLEKVKRILINDSRVSKIYTIPDSNTKSGNIVRVARLYKLLWGGEKRGEMNYSKIKFRN